jgi:regulator of protease activity HflC (stomatin/prohibitin superfamily)
MSDKQIGIFGGLGIMILVGAYLWLWPLYGVWRAGLTGKASLMRAEQEKLIQIEQAKAELESAKLRAEAISIVGEASKQFPEYRTQEFIGAFAEAVQSGAIDQIIYVPTEANIPIVEAGKR